ncbi:hypothetical protein ARMSODRAFT_982352 [Armillaria solidipes]|uniref:Uncharacterized protein n=1 Tax=Armillaria solidipes TaxID=1076256 RepID=A0A2H3B028_9AGAR|nr:hypothetical protein ARMSODRAFT_982352 [Armillaria solidipes]
MLQLQKDPPKARKPPSQSNGKINYDLYIEKGPFKFTSNQPFEDYITAIAAMLQCHKSKLILDKLKYKQKVPQTSQIHSLTSDLIFTALIEEMCAAKTVNKWIMYIFSPAPMHPASDEAWWMTTDEDRQESVPSGFNFSQLEWQETEDSVATQRKKFDDTVRPFIVKLEEKFPVDNFPMLFPGRCVYKNIAGYYFDLDPGVLSSWASHWQANNTAPMPIPAPAASTISDTPFGGNLLEYFLLQQQQQQQQHQQFQQMLQLQMLQTTHSSLSCPPFIPSAPPSPAKILVVSLEAFCAHYGVNNADHDHLQELGYTSGNKDIKTLE